MRHIQLHLIDLRFYVSYNIFTVLVVYFWTFSSRCKEYKKKKFKKQKQNTCSKNKQKTTTKLNRRCKKKTHTQTEQKGITNSEIV